MSITLLSILNIETVAHPLGLGKQVVLPQVRTNSKRLLPEGVKYGSESKQAKERKHAVCSGMFHSERRDAVPSGQNKQSGGRQRIAAPLYSVVPSKVIDSLTESTTFFLCTCFFNCLV